MTPDPDPSAPAAAKAGLFSSLGLFAKAFYDSPALMTIAALPEGRFVEVNRAFLRTSGFQREEVIGRTTAEMGVWQRPEQRAEFMAIFAEKKEVRDFEADFRVPGGQRTLLLNADLIELEGVPCILTVSVDISERRHRARAEAALAAAEARYRSIFENAVEGLYVSSAAGRFLSVNPALARLCGYDSPGAMLAAINDIGTQLYVDPNRRAEFLRLAEQFDVVPDFVSEIVRADGARRWLSESVRIVRDPAGRISQLEGVAIDITAQREAAQALAAAKEEADAASRAKSQFLAAASHELRTPLNGILGYTQILLRDEALAARQREAVRVIHESAEHLLVVINDVLDLSRVEARRLELHPTDFDPRELIAGIERVFVPKAREKNLLFEAAVSPQLAEAVNGDPHRLRQVLYNLVGNAVKFTRQGGVVLSAQPAGAGRVRFAVSDTGPGISPEDLGRLFQPFAQVAASEQEGGSGLGLAISRGLVELLGGRLEVESRPGWGSRFWFEIPLAPSAVRIARSDTSRRAIGYDGPRRRILVADDNVTNRSLLVELLQSVGFGVLEAADGAAAAAACDTDPPDLVLMDIRMPVMDGLEATRRIRARHPAGAPVVLAVSASVHDVDRRECFGAGCADFLAKPFRETELWEKLGRHLGLEWRWGGATPPSAPAVRAPLDVPAPEVIEELHELASRGDILALRERARQIADREPALDPFVGSLLELAAKFKMKAIREFLQRHRPDAR